VCPVIGVTSIAPSDARQLLKRTTCDNYCHTFNFPPHTSSQYTHILTGQANPISRKSVDRILTRQRTGSKGLRHSSTITIRNTHTHTHTHTVAQMCLLTFPFSMCWTIFTLSVQYTLLVNWQFLVTRCSESNAIKFCINTSTYTLNSEERNSARIERNILSCESGKRDHSFTIYFHRWNFRWEKRWNLYGTFFRWEHVKWSETKGLFISSKIGK